MIHRHTANRRTFLRASGVGLALPLLDAFLPRRAWAAPVAIPQRMVCICTSLGLHAPFLFPDQAGSDYELTPYLKLLEEHRKDFTLFSGLSHPDQSGADGHSSGMTWLTAARHPGLAGFRNSISIDQWIADRIGLETRFPSLQLSTDGSSQSYTRSGIMIPGEQSPSKMFAKLFLDGSAEERETQVQRLREGRSIMDTVREEAKQFGRRVGKDDREKLAEYFHSVREMEQRLNAAEAWIHKPKPHVDAQSPQDVTDRNDLIGQMELLFELIPLALQTDSTRLITVMIQGRNDVPPVPGVSIDHHNLSHHGQDEDKIRQLRLVEEAQFRSLEKLLADMKRKTEDGQRLLDNTSLVFGSNLGNANAHDTTNLPILLAGGRFRHGQHLKLDRTNNAPFSNLFVQVAQQMNQPIESFGSSTATSIDGLAIRA
ncbi:hypothetical protein Poly51_30820 [Rubripirellula tenax]|uniref:DUF1552 domain-containing protein n=1 Tax=Rubripirellula tenax TaxID=2528015 RepID=A0A5C6EZY2_9BACT|nr:DUF1552 domain-containing protein [Rubripirellula tenax]TWU54365.1 hypothetical protein Poly51_30820 [Rubripirellula tenax]